MATSKTLRAQGVGKLVSLLGQLTVAQAFAADRVDEGGFFGPGGVACQQVMRGVVAAWDGDLGWLGTVVGGALVHFCLESFF
jgi:hypothetical protein